MRRRIAGWGTASGIGCVLVSMVALSLQDSLIKWLGATYPLHEIVLGRALVALGVIVSVLWATSGLHRLRTHRLGLHLARGGLLVAANSAFFLGLIAMPVAEATAIFFVAPLFITMLSVVVLGEPVGPRRLLAVVVGFAGVLVMVRPGSGALGHAALLPVFAALAYATMQILTRRLGVTDGAAAMAFYVHLSFVVAGVAMGLAVGHGRFAGSGDPSLEFLLRPWHLPAGSDLALVLVIGLLVAGASLLLSQAYRITEATTLAPFEYVALPLTALWGFLLWGEVPDAVALLGMGMIVASGLVVIRRSRRLREGPARRSANAHPS